MVSAAPITTEGEKVFKFGPDQVRTVGLAVLRVEKQLAHIKNNLLAVDKNPSKGHCARRVAKHGALLSDEARKLEDAAYKLAPLWLTEDSEHLHAPPKSAFDGNYAYSVSVAPSDVTNFAPDWAFVCDCGECFGCVDRINNLLTNPPTEETAAHVADARHP